MSLGIALAAVAAIAAATAIAVVLWERGKTGRILDRIGKMLDDATAGHFSEEHFDESRLSALETKFAHYLASSAASAQNIEVERDKIKSLIADISHQTKTPISNLLLYSELLAESDLSDETRSNVEAVHRQAETLRFLIDSLVKLSRLENGVLTLAPRREPLWPMLNNIYGKYAVRAEEKGLVFRMEETDACAVFDAKWTEEALCNIVDNAIKYTSEGGVTLSVSEYNLFCRIDVSDTGLGILEEELPKVFARFYRAESVRDREGVGLGLYLAREIISGEGGYIKISSPVGQGATFSVFLPMSSE